ncbi:MAG: hypothetical protein IKC46_00770 [Lachnospiraceae bacterium]|nr:hypothetical protein [Lachnospiraceae bacterium]
MKHKKNKLRQSLFALVLAAVVFWSSLIPANADMMEFSQYNNEFEVQVVNGADNQFTGKFMRYNGEVYISADSLTNIKNVQFHYHDTQICFYREDVFPMDYIPEEMADEEFREATGGRRRNIFRRIVKAPGADIEIDYGSGDGHAHILDPYILTYNPSGEESIVEQSDGEIFVNFAEAMAELCLYSVFDYDKKILYVINQKNIWSIHNYLEKVVYADAAYNMAYWRAEYCFDVETSKNWAAFSDAIKNLHKIPSYLTGYADYELYFNEALKILIPQVNEKLIVAQDTMELMDFTSSIGGMGTEAMDKLGTSFWGTGALKKFCWALDYTSKINTALQGDDLLSVASSMRNIMNMSDSVHNGLQTAVNYSRGSIDKQCTEALDAVLDLVKSGKYSSDDLAAQFAEGFAEILIKETTGKVISIWGDVSNLVTDEILKGIFGSSSQEQMNATLGAAANLTIQDAVGYAHSNFLRLVEGKRDDYESFVEEQMRDLALVYLLAAQNAQEAVNIDKSMNYGTKMIIDRASLCMEYLNSFHEEDFDTPRQAVETARSLYSYGYYGRSGVEYMMYWNSEISGRATDVELNLVGTASNGHKIQYIPYDEINGSFVDEDGMAVATLIISGTYAQLCILDTAGDYELQITQGADWEPNYGIGSVDLYAASYGIEKGMYMTNQEEDFDKYLIYEGASGYYQIPFSGGYPGW